MTGLRTRVFWWRRGDHTPGHLVYDGRLVRFEPSWSGPGFEVACDALRRISVVGRAAVLRTVDGNYRLTGARLAPVVRAIEQGVVQRRLQRLQISVGDEEQVLVCGEASLHDSPLVTTPVLLVVTDRRIGIVAHPAGLSCHPVDVALDEVRVSALLGRRRHWHVDAGRRPLVLGGPTALRAHAALGDRVPRDVGVVHARMPAVLPERRPARGSVLEVTPGWVRLRDDDDTVWVDLQVRTLAALRPSAVHPDVLVVDTLDQPVRLRVESVEQAVAAIAWAWLDAPPAPPDSVAHGAVLVEPAIRWLDDGSRIQFGWWVCRSTEVAFHPVHSLRGGTAAPVRVPRGSLQWLPADAADPWVVHVAADGQPIVLTLAGGAEAGQRFWDLLGADAQADVVPSDPCPVLRTMAGEVLRVRVQQRCRAVFEHRNALLAVSNSTPRCLRIGFPGTPDRSLDVGEPLRVSIARADALYVFDTLVWAIERPEPGAATAGRNDDGAGQDAPRGAETVAGDCLGVSAAPTRPPVYEIHILCPGRALRINRRGAFRVPLNPPGKAVLEVITDIDPAATAQMDARRLDVLVLDLSMAGAAIACRQPIEEGSTVVLEIPAPGGPIVASGRVAHVTPPGGGCTWWRAGIAFAPLDEAQQHRLHAEVMARQRAYLRYQKALRDALEADVLH